MIEYMARVAGHGKLICAVENEGDYTEVSKFLRWHEGVPMAFDTESTSFKGMYRPDWRLRLFQFGTADLAYVIPVEHRDLVVTVLDFEERQWVAHNAPHDVLSLDRWLGYETKLLPHCTDTYIMAHLLDPRPKHEGGLGLKLKELANALVDPHATDGEKELKEEFKKLMVPMPGVFYKSGKRQGEQRYRKANLHEGWALIDTYNEAYLRYSGLDPLLTMLVYEQLEIRLKEEYGVE